MFFTKALRSTTTMAMNHASQTTTKAVVRSGRRVGEAWAVTEARRLGPTIVMYSAFMVAVLGWPYIVRKADMGIGLHGMEK